MGGLRGISSLLWRPSLLACNLQPPSIRFYFFEACLSKGIDYLIFSATGLGLAT